MQDLKFIDGDLVYLRSHVEDDFGDRMLQWINDKEVTFYLSRGTYPANRQELKNEYQQLTGRKDEVSFAICDKSTNEHIGVVSLNGINYISRHAEFRILIGNKKCWGKGFGLEACQLIIGYGFHVLNLQKIWLGVNADNAKAHRSYTNCGFTLEGRLRNEIYRNGAYHDIVRMSMLREEYKGQHQTWKSKQKIESQLGALS